jgi:hypothetical protein
MIDMPDSEPRALPSGGARCPFGVRAELSPVRFRIETAFGGCDLAAHHPPTLSGTLLEYLRPGALEVALGQDGGGYCACHPRLIGAIEDAPEGDSPPLTVALLSLALSPHSRPFGISSAGDFLALSHWEITSGSLELGLPGWGTRSIDLRGWTSPEHSGLGRIRFDADGVHLTRSLDLQFNLREPARGMRMVLQVHGLLCGEMSYPGDWPMRSRSERERLRSA